MNTQASTTCQTHDWQVTNTIGKYRCATCNTTGCCPYCVPGAKGRTIRVLCKKHAEAVRRQRIRQQTTDEASPHSAGHYAGLHPEDQPHVTTQDMQEQLSRSPVTRADVQPSQQYQTEEMEDGGDEYPSRSPRSALRYRLNLPTRSQAGLPALLQPGRTFIGDNGKEYVVVAGQKPTPARASRSDAQTVAPPRTYTTAPQEPAPPAQAVSIRQKRHFHPLLWIGVGALALLILAIGLNNLLNWWSGVQDDWKYTSTFRTFSIDAVVGHHDSSASPSHFVCQNIHGEVVIIELEGGDLSKSSIYTGPSVAGDNRDRTPVTLSFQLNPQTGREDMVLHIDGQIVVFTNDGSKFIPPPPGQR